MVGWKKAPQILIPTAVDVKYLLSVYTRSIMFSHAGFVICYKVQGTVIVILFSAEKYNAPFIVLN